MGASFIELSDSLPWKYFFLNGYFFTNPRNYYSTHTEELCRAIFCLLAKRSKVKKGKTKDCTHPGCCLLCGCLCGTYIRRWLKGVGVYLKLRKWKWCILALLGCTLARSWCIVELFGCTSALLGCILALLGCILELFGCISALLGCILALLGSILALLGSILALLFCRLDRPAVGRLPTLLVFSTRLNNLMMKTTMTKIEIKVVVSSNMMFVVAS